MNLIEKQIFDDERALYGVRNIKIKECSFDGPKDGESALKESAGIKVSNCDFRLRCPFWQVKNAHIEDSRMTGDSMAALWYDEDVTLKNCRIESIKAMRECSGFNIEHCNIHSMEFGWYSRNLRLVNCKIIGTQPLCYAEGLILEGCEMVDCDLSFEKSRVKADIVGSITSVKNPLSCSIVADGIGEIMEDGDSTGSRCQIQIK